MDWSGYLAQQGRGNDTLVAHITPEEAMLLKRRGGSGTRNPKTGLLEFWDDGGNDPDGVGGSMGSTGFGGGYGTSGGDWGEPDNYGGWGGPTANDPDVSITDKIAGWFENLTLMDVVKGVIKGGLTIASIAQNPVMGTAKAVSKGLGFSIPSPMDMVGYGLKESYNGFFGTDEQKATQIENTTKSFDDSVAAALSGKERDIEGGSTTPDWGGMEGVVGNEKTLDKLFTKFGEIGDFQGAVNAAKTFETTAGVKAQLESEIIRYSKDPLYEAIEPEFRSVADAAQENGMEPKVAAEYAFAKVKEAYNARKYIKEYLDRKRKELSEGEDAA